MSNNVRNEEDNPDIYKFEREYKGKTYFELEKKDSKKPQEWINNNCNDKTNYLTSDDFTDEDYSDMYAIKILNSRNKFDIGVCSTKEELITSLKADLNYVNEEDPTDIPSSIMSICTSPNDGNSAGFSAKPTIRIIVKITINNIYVTLGSIHRIMKESNNKVWYALPMFDGKKRRVGNLGGVHGSSMNHCQLPGFVIYKLYTKKEITNSIKVKQLASDYPIGYRLSNDVFTLFDLYDKYNINARKFATKIVTDIEYLYKDVDFDDIEEANEANNDNSELTELNLFNELLGTDPEFRLRVRNSPGFLESIRDNDPYITLLRGFSNFNILIDEIIAEQNAQVPRPVHRRDLPVDFSNAPLNVQESRPDHHRDVPPRAKRSKTSRPPRAKRSKTSRASRTKKSKTSRASRTKKSKTSRASRTKKSKTSRASRTKKSKTPRN
jgi:hypothetical protein